MTHIYVPRNSETEDALCLARLTTERDFWKNRAKHLQDRLEEIAVAARRGKPILIDALGHPVMTLVVAPKTDAEAAE